MLDTRTNRVGRDAERSRLLTEYLSAHSLSLAAISRALEFSDGEIAFVTGSVIDGVGDSQSDLDIYILTSREDFERRSVHFHHERQNQQERQEFGIIYCDVNGREFDVECHLAEKFHELLRQLACLDPLDRDCLWRNFRGLGRFERTEATELLHRLRIGVPIWNETRYEELRRAFDEQKYLAWHAHVHLIEAEDYLKGVTRSLRENDSENAYIKILRLFDSLADAKLFLCGESLDRWKWRLPKLRKLADDAFLQLYLDVQIGRSDPAGPHARVGSLLERAREIHREFYEQLRRNQ